MLRGKSCADTKASDDNLFLEEGLLTLINVYNILTCVWSCDLFSWPDQMSGGTRLVQSLVKILITAGVKPCGQYLLRGLSLTVKPCFAIPFFVAASV